MNFLLLFIVPCLSKHLVEYHLGYNFGLNIFDFSGAGRDGKVETANTASSTDRGLYFFGKKHALSIPSFDMPAQMSTVLWVMLKAEGQIFNQGDSNTFLKFSKISAELSLLTSSEFLETSDLCLVENKWLLIFFKRNSSEFVLSSSICNEKLTLSYSGGSDLLLIGGQSPNKRSFIGFLWYFLMTEGMITLDEVVNPSPSLYSIIGSPDFCEETFKDPLYGEVCISDETEEYKDASSNDCPTDTHCSGTFIYNCTCTTFCFYDLLSLIPSCSVTHCPASLVAREGKCCNEECGSCLNSDFCTSCIDPLAVTVSGLCSCKAGYFGLPSKNTSTGCLTCQNACLDCENSETCIECKSPSTLKLGKCICDDGFYMVQGDLNDFQCVACPDGCSSCDGKKCFSCFDPNAQVLDVLCSCIDSFFGSPQKQDGSSGCLKCSEDCKTCEDYQVCLSCSDPNSRPVEGVCECREGYFLDTGSLKCLECDKDCKSCDNKKTCKTCLAQNSKPSTSQGCECLPGFFNKTSLISLHSCQKCSGLCSSCFSNSVCLACFGKFTELKEGSCSCRPGYFRNSSSYLDCVSCSEDSGQDACFFECPEGSVLKNGMCQECESLCKVCDSDLNCLECTSNTLKKNQSCECKKGFKEKDNSCKASHFSAHLEVLSNNSILLKFQKALETKISTKNIKLQIKGKNKQISLKLVKDDELLVDLNELIYFKDKTKFILSLTEPVYSSDGSVLKDRSYEGLLNSFKQSNFAKKVKTSIQIVIATTFVSSVCSNPAGFWVFVNTMQVIFYMPLATLDFSSRLLEFIRALSGYSLLPNVFLYIFKPEESSGPNRREENIGISSTVFWINIGPNFMVLFAYLILIPVFCIGSRFGFCRIYCLKKMKNYQYSVFIRFFIESFLELGLFALIQLRSYENNEFQGIFNKISAAIIIALFGVFPLFSVVMLFKFRYRMEVPEILTKFGSFYDEFKVNSKFCECLFYPIFLLRRSQYVLTQLFLSSVPKIQLLFNIIFTFIQLTYVLYCKPFKNKEVLISQILGDFSVLVLFCISGFYLSSIEDHTNYIIDTIFIVITVICVGIQTLASMFSFFQIILKRLKKCRRWKSKEITSSKICPIPNSPNASNIEIMEKVHLNCL